MYLLFPNGLDNWHIIFIMTYLIKAYSRENEMFGGVFPGYSPPVTQ